MRTIHPTITLGSLVTEHPELARELERRHLDYCCGGSMTLTDACACTGLDVDAFIDELTMLAEPTATPDWVGLGPVELVDHLEATHHRYLWDGLPRLTDLTAKCRRSTVNDTPSSSTSPTASPSCAPISNRTCSRRSECCSR